MSNPSPHLLFRKLPSSSCCPAVLHARTAWGQFWHPPVATLAPMPVNLLQECECVTTTLQGELARNTVLAPCLPWHAPPCCCLTQINALLAPRPGPTQKRVRTLRAKPCAGLQCLQTQNAGEGACWMCAEALHPGHTATLLLCCEARGLRSLCRLYDWQNRLRCLATCRQRKHKEGDIKQQ